MIDPRHSDLFRGLSDPELDLARRYLERHEYQAGETIIQWGEQADSLHVIESGLVSVTIPDREGERLVAQLGPGQLFGEMAILTGKPRSAAVRTLVRTTTLALSFKAFYQVAGASPTMLLNIGRVLASRLGQERRSIAQRDRRSIIALCGSSPPVLASLVATNLAVALALVSGRRAVLVDGTGRHASPLQGREWVPSVEELRGGDEYIARLTRLHVGALELHAAGLPDGADVDGAALSAGVSRLAGLGEFVVLNLTGRSTETLRALLPLATRALLLVNLAEVRGDETRRQLAVIRQQVSSGADIGTIALAGGGASPSTARQLVAAESGVPCECVLPGAASVLRDAAAAKPPMVLTDSDLPSVRALTALARRVAGLRVGLALGSGAAKGVAHVGLVAGLRRLGVPIDVVAGTSIGALVGAGVALGMDVQQMNESMDRLVDLWGDALKLTVPRFSVFRAEGLERIVSQVAGDIQFEELPTPFGAVATDLLTGRAVRIRQGSVARAIRASIGIPLVFPPVEAGEYLLVDGFLTNPVPTLFTRELGADVVIASNLSRPVEESQDAPIDLALGIEEKGGGRRAPNILETYMRCQDIIMAGRGEHDCLSADITLRPRLSGVGWREFQKGGAPLEAGERAVEEQLDGLRALFPWLRTAAG